MPPGVSTLNVTRFNAAISACEKCRSWQRVAPSFDDVQSRVSTLDVISSSAATSASAEGEQ
eukprot:7135950-Karenia_brevis.AAC.1